MQSPQKKIKRATSAGRRSVNSPRNQSPSSRQSRMTPSKPLDPFVQDTLNRLTSPYKKSHDNSSTKFSSAMLDFPSRFEDDDDDFINHSVVTPKKPKTAKGGRSERSRSPKSAKGKKVEFVDKNRSQKSAKGGKFDSARKGSPTNAKGRRSELLNRTRSPKSETPRKLQGQEKVEYNLKDSLTTLKLVMREYEERQQEKKIMQKVVEQLKLQITSLQSRRTSFGKNFEKLHKDSLLMNDAANTKENQRKLISKNVEQVKDDVVKYDKDIQDAIIQNVDVANRIKQEQIAILKMKEKISELKKKLPVEMRDKEKARNDLQVSANQLRGFQQKFDTLSKEKKGYVDAINGSKAIKQ